MFIGVDPFLGLAGKGLMRSSWGSSPVGRGAELIQQVDVSEFILLRGQNVAKELELT